VPCLLIGQIDQRADYSQHRYANGSAVIPQLSLQVKCPIGYSQSGIFIFLANLGLR
jgi:hypothetical protein